MKLMRIHDAKRLLIILTTNIIVSPDADPDRDGHLATYTSPFPHEMGTPAPPLCRRGAGRRVWVLPALVGGVRDAP